ncbi:DUF4291 family protein [Nostoc sp. NMS4]|uniref:DUF4291 family protein n=1 Tax=Nostoc sp. NMS4 TaxID=2815390 RepID=UPI0025F0AD84|nr:DUF4291 family protein [Nostoc sp. NMS4]MBN3922876.1 DUF4291 family protein [Nostoc sp. NMS4]
MLAQYDDQSIIIYQAYLPAITKFAVYHSYFDCTELITARETVYSGLIAKCIRKLRLSAWIE